MSTPLEAKKKMQKKFKKIITIVILLGILFSVIVFTDFFETKEAEAGWYATGGTWGYRKAITIDHTKVPDTDASGGEIDFPVLIDITDTSLQANAKSDGFDILFTSSDGTTKLAHEREIYTTATGQLTAWVKIPTLSSTVDTTIYIYYGNASATDQADPTNVWDTNYKGVWHLPDGTTLSGTDTIGNGNGSAVGTPVASSAKIDGGMVMDADGDYINAGNSSLFNFTSSAFTVEVWLKPPSSGQPDWNTFVARGEYIADGWYIQTDNSANKNGIYFVTNQFGYNQPTVAANKLTTNAWNHVVVVRNGSGAKIYVNGTDQTTSAGYHFNPSSSTRNLILGSWLGSMDEVRISNTNRSADWIATSYNNQASPSTFYSIGGADDTVPDTNIKVQANTLWHNDSWGYAKKITVDHTKVSGSANLNDFPVLISLSEADLRTVANGGYVGTADGTDILFVGENGTKLDHEIEKYTPTTGELIAWVRVPVLYPTNNTNIIMYFGNAGASDQQNVTGVWGSDYRAVWHMGESATPTIDSKNSISLGDNGTGTVFGSIGKFDLAVSGDGSNDELTTAHTDTLNFSSALTMSVWLKLDDYGEVGPIIQKRGQTTYCDANYNYGFFITQTTGYPYFEYGASCAGITDSSSAIGTGSWVHLTIVIDEAGDTIKFYRNGSQSNSTAFTDTMPAVGTAPVDVLGYSNTDFATYNMDGSMDELRMAAAARSADWIATEYANQSATSTFYTISSTLTAANIGEASNSTTTKVKVRGGVKFR